MRVIQIVILFLCAGVISGQQISDLEAEKVIKDLRAKYQSFSSIEATFDLDIDYRQGKTDHQQGTLIQQGTNFKMDATTQAIYCDSKSVWVHLKESKEVQINDYDPEEEVANFSPNSILALYDNGEYEYAITNESIKSGVLIQQIEFKPLDQDSEYAKIRLSIDKKKQELSGFELFTKDLTKVSLKIRSLSVDNIYPNNIFIFNKSENPNVYIEDLRID